MIQSEQKTAVKNTKKIFIYNALFVLVCGSIFLFLWEAPPETTAKVPSDQNHARFFPMDKKEAEKECNACHNPEGISPLSSGHPPKYRCLFCHKKGKKPC